MIEEWYNNDPTEAFGGDDDKDIKILIMASHPISGRSWKWKVAFEREDNNDKFYNSWPWKARAFR
jgi:hypothetical protein